jgi:hypothetical protein
MPADFGEIGFARARFVDKAAVEHHDDSVGQLEQLIQIFASVD